MWTTKQEIDQLQEILDELKKEITECTSENIREIIDEPYDSRGARILEGYKGLKGAWYNVSPNGDSGWEKKKAVDKFKKHVESCIEWAKKQ